MQRCITNCPSLVINQENKGTQKMNSRALNQGQTSPGFRESIPEMKKIDKIAEKIFKFLCSLKLAVIVIVSLGTIAAIGTIVESKYDMITAQKLVYHSPYMYGVMIFLC